MKSQIKTKKNVKKQESNNKNSKHSKSNKHSKKHKISYSKNRNKKGGSNMNDVDIDEIGDVSDALDLDLNSKVNEYFGSGSGQKRGIFDSAKVTNSNMDSSRTEMPQLKCTIL
jgi:hypothetical protein